MVQASELEETHETAGHASSHPDVERDEINSDTPSTSGFINLPRERW
jgi:hypothetical protein